MKVENMYRKEQRDGNHFYTFISPEEINDLVLLGQKEGLTEIHISR